GARGGGVQGGGGPAPQGQRHALGRGRRRRRRPAAGAVQGREGPVGRLLGRRRVRKLPTRKTLTHPAPPQDLGVQTHGAAARRRCRPGTRPGCTRTWRTVAPPSRPGFRSRGSVYSFAAVTGSAVRTCTSTNARRSTRATPFCVLSTPPLFISKTR